MMKTVVGFIALLALVSPTYALHAAVKQKDSTSYCIILDADASGTITYQDLMNQTKTYDFTMNNATYVSGTCMGIKNDVTTESITIAFYPNNVTPTIAAEPWELFIEFKENSEQTNNAYKISDFNLTAVLYDGDFNATQHVVTYVQAPDANLEWHGEQARGYKCSKAGLSLTNGTSIVFKDLKVIAFGLLDSDKMPEKQEFDQCPLDVRTSDVVPIVVGACLAGLVIIVLIAYLIGRARAKRQGYASV